MNIAAVDQHIVAVVPRVTSVSMVADRCRRLARVRRWISAPAQA